MSFFIISFLVLVAVCVGLYFYSRKSGTKIEGSSDPGFVYFRNLYLVVYLLGMAGDWLQGPYVYALYEHYKLSKRDIEFLFVAGFGASMLFGTVVGSFSDKFGRQRNCILYGIIYSLSCLTKHSSNFWVLLLGRLLGGTATSILWSGFETWLIHEHHSRGYSDRLLEEIFSWATIGNSIVAIVCGVAAQYAVDLFGFVAPFDMALIILVIMTVIVWLKWPENYGDASADLKKNFSDALTTVRTDRRVLCLGVVQSLFEGSMYCFVLEWTPALTPSAASTMSSGHAGKIPHGYIFAAYMVSLMIGGQLFSFCCNRSKPESFMRWVFGLSSVCLVQPALMRSDSLIPITFVGFLVFECCVGLFWPAIGTMRSKYVPDSIRATIMNLFRIPLNLVVVIILTQNFPIVFIFKCCVFFLIICCGIQFYLERLTRDEAPVESADGQTAEKSTEDDRKEFQGIA
ncbi:hypothetical protein BOX15_Mlig006233g2 [Macrostomum lignano]|uniref:Major facilitator superfamily domain-containing protein 5 n=1 Tax=Macrostomum lignano TaxID=282301 RepID=A0A267GA72_9PLAT|nr:hypothetical protein BOX15_Mlig006233g2 [Macrostomum lignano]